jgi:hypothetical protein
MLLNCFVGNYVDTASVQSLKISSSKSNQFLQMSNLNLSHASDSSLRSITVTQTPKMDTYATQEKIVLIVYTKWTEMSSEFVLIKTNNDENMLLIYLYVKQDVFEYKIGKSLNEIRVRIGSNLFILSIFKSSRQSWHRTTMVIMAFSFWLFWPNI